MDRYNGYAPCPCCFESSGHPSVYIPATWWEPAWEDVDYSRNCPECNGTGLVECEPATFDDLIEEWFEADEALDRSLSTMAREHSEGRVGPVSIQQNEVA